MRKNSSAEGQKGKRTEGQKGELKGDGKRNDPQMKMMNADEES
jgi:hypothetical protein